MTSKPTSTPPAPSASTASTTKAPPSSARNSRGSERTFLAASRHCCVGPGCYRRFGIWLERIDKTRCDEARCCRAVEDHTVLDRARHVLAEGPPDADRENEHGPAGRPEGGHHQAQD